ncbi:hypothetical protein BGX33_001751 [Mortierella sp. NVP41]|nr:hypothetical protein BGX33_001751 [Mortierella sp. NVP41]
MSTRPCRFFLAGTCRNGTDCHFYHEGFSGIPRAVLSGDSEMSISPGHRTEGTGAATTRQGGRSTSPTSPSSSSSTAQTPNSYTSSSSSSNARPAYAATKPCNWYMAGYCLRGDNCWFSHDRAIIEGRTRGGGVVEDGAATTPGQANEDTSASGAAEARAGGSNDDDDNEDQKCAICFEVPTTFGLLATPGQKELIIQNYKVVSARRPCKYFKESGDRHWCPFGDDCFFAHRNAQGEPCKVNPRSNPRLNRRRYNDGGLGGRNLFRRRAGFEGYSGYNGGGGYRASRNRFQQELLENLTIIHMAGASVPQGQLEGVQGLLLQLARLSVEDPNFNPQDHPELRVLSAAFEEYEPGRYPLHEVHHDDYYHVADDDDDDDDEDNWEDEDEDDEDEDDNDDDSETTLERDEREAYEEFGDDLHFETYFGSAALPQDTVSNGWDDHDIDAYHDSVWAEYEDYY